MKKLISAVMAGAMVASMASVATFANWGGTGATTEPLTITSAYVGDASTANVLSSGTSFNVNPNKTIYYDIPMVSGTSSWDLADSDFFKFKVKKNDGSKIISSVKIVEKVVAGINGGVRDRAIEVKLKEDMTDKETKVDMTFTFTATQKGVDARKAAYVGDKAVGDVTFYVSNTASNTEDTAWQAGTGGYIARPVKNEENEVLWEDENRELALLEFSADSDVVKYFPKLSTVWDNEAYRVNFSEGDAFIFKFLGKPAISSTSRADLTIYNPFINADEEYSVSMDELTIYMENADGDLEDVTDEFTAKIDDDGREVFVTKTRQLGTYVIADAAAAAQETIVDDVVPVTPEVVKPNPGTGR